MRNRATVVFDFDGVIHRYGHGWQGPDVIDDVPVEGIREAMRGIMDAGYQVVIVSSRCACAEGISAMRAWLSRWAIPYDGLTAEKPPAVAYIDDRAICFDGDAGKLLSQIKHFRPWYQRGGAGTRDA
ncbi:MAG TPA: hypothetical protein PLD83_04385 [Oscillospiraceae bacterium]|nr:hypothetical protein [Oscillospiraceae bacterium]